MNETLLSQFGSLLTQLTREGFLRAGKDGLIEKMVKDLEQRRIMVIAQEEF